MDTNKKDNHFNNSFVVILFLALIVLGGYLLFSKSSDNVNTQNPISQGTIQASSTNPQQNEIDALKKEIENLKNKNPQTIVKQVPDPAPNQSNQITSEQLAPFLDGVVIIYCKSVYGSGSLWEINGKYFVVTNNHVINQDTSSDGSCTVWDIIENGTGMYKVYPAYSTRWNAFSDVAVLELYNDNDFVNAPKAVKFPDINTLDYKIGALPKCTNYVRQGSPVFALGYPTYGEGLALATTNGVISGYGGVASLSAPYPNYIISAKIDSGNSGGVAISLNPQGQLCLLGIPTWISTGNYENGGIVQNINNITYDGPDWVKIMNTK